MHVNVPQFIDIEDKIAFGLTAKQLLWMAGMGASLLALYNLVDRQGFYVTAIPVVLIFVALAFWRPEGVSLLTFTGYALRYLMKPRNFVWRRSYSGAQADIRKATLVQRGKLPPPVHAKTAPTVSQLRDMAWRLDTKK